MKPTSVVLPVLLLGLTLSCSSSQKDSRFDKQIELKFNSLGVEDLFYKPLCIEIFDSLLLICDPTPESVYKILNINTKQIICEGVNIGEGPYELLSPTLIDRIDNHRFQVMDIAKIVCYDINEIIKTGNFLPYSIISYDVVGKTKDLTRRFYEIDDSSYIALGIFKEAKYMLSSKGEMKLGGNYPTSEEKNVHPFLVHQGVMHVDRERKLLLYHSPFGYYYELLSYANEKITTLCYDYSPHSYKIINGECLITAQTPCGINDAEILNEGILLLYSGTTMEESPKMHFYCKKIWNLDLQGKYQTEYLLERPTAMMAVNEQNSTIYAITVHPDTYELELGFYRY